MSLSKLSELLCRGDHDECVFSIIPPWIDASPEEGDAVERAWKDVRELARQRDELKRIWPDRAHRWDSDFNDCVVEVARGLQREIPEVLTLMTLTGFME